MSDYSWNCYRETIFEKEIQKLEQEEPDNPVLKYLQKRLEEVRKELK